MSRRPVDVALDIISGDPNATALRALVTLGPNAVRHTPLAHGGEPFHLAVCVLSFGPTERRGDAVELAVWGASASIGPLLNILERPVFHWGLFREVIAAAGYRDDAAEEQFHLAHKRVCELALHALTAVEAVGFDVSSYWAARTTAAHYQDPTYGEPVMAETVDQEIAAAAAKLAEAIGGLEIGGTPLDVADFRTALVAWPLPPYEPRLGPKATAARRRREAIRRDRADQAAAAWADYGYATQKGGGGCLLLVSVALALVVRGQWSPDLPGSRNKRTH